jgi:2-oxoglutarate ferredoxin oxidoreductase subunit alpha
MPPGIGEILRRFRKVITIEGTWSDRLEDEVVDGDNRRYAPLAMMLRSRFLVDVDCWSEARGAPMKPVNVVKALRAKLAEGERA